MPASPPPLRAARAVQLLRLPALGTTHLQRAPTTGEVTCPPSPPHHPPARAPCSGTRAKGKALAAAAGAASGASGRRPCPALNELDVDVRLAPEGILRVGGGVKCQYAPPPRGWGGFTSGCLHACMHACMHAVATCLPSRPLTSHKTTPSEKTSERRSHHKQLRGPPQDRALPLLARLLELGAGGPRGARELLQRQQQGQEQWWEGDGQQQRQSCPTQPPT